MCSDRPTAGTTFVIGLSDLRRTIFYISQFSQFEVIRANHTIKQNHFRTGRRRAGSSLANTGDQNLWNCESKVTS